MEMMKSRWSLRGNVRVIKVGNSISKSLKLELLVGFFLTSLLRMIQVM